MSAKLGLPVHADYPGNLDTSVIQATGHPGQ